MFILSLITVPWGCGKSNSNETPTWCNTMQVLFLQSHSTCFGRKRPKHVEWLCRNKTCTVLHQVGVSFELYYDARKYKIKRCGKYITTDIIHLGIVRRCVVAFTPHLFHARYKATVSHWIWVWKDRRANLVASEKRKASCPCWDSNSDLSIQTVAWTFWNKLIFCINFLGILFEFLIIRNLLTWR